MTTDATVSLSCIIAVCGFLIAIYNFYISRKKDTIAEQEEQNKIKEDFIKVNLKLDNICQNLTEIRTETKTISKDIKEIDTRVAILETNQKALWRTIEEIKGESR